MREPLVCNPLQLTRSPFAIHSVSVHASTQHSQALGTAPARPTQKERFLFSAARTEKKGVCRSLQVCCKDEPATPRRAKSCTPRSDSRTSFPTCIFPEAHLREMLNWVHAGAEHSGDSKREWESQRPARRCSATRAEMHRHSRACSRPDCTFRARDRWALPSAAAWRAPARN